MIRSTSSRLLLAAALVATGMLWAVGCNGGGKVERIIDESDGAGGAGLADADEGQCDRWLENGTATLLPGKLGRSTEPSGAAQLLSLYLAQFACTGVPPGPLTLSDDPEEAAAAEALLQRLLGEAGAESVTERRIDAADARFFRTRIMDSAAVDAVVSRDAAPETIAVALNRYVADRLFPLGEKERPAGGTYHARLRGEGDWADRAWLLADLLRQASLDSVLLTPWGTGDPDEPTAWVGVLLPGADGGDGESAPETALFDMRTGLPVPSPNDADRPVRLSEVRSDPAAREAMTAFYQTAGLPVPETAALDDLPPQLIGEPGWWRLASRLIALPPTPGAVAGLRPRASDALHDQAGEPGLVSRVAAAGFEAETQTIWPLPAERAAASDPPVPVTLSAPLRFGLKPPGGVTVDEGGRFFNSKGLPIANADGSEVEAAPSDELWRARHLQLAGGRSGAREAAGLLEGLLSPDRPGSLNAVRPLPPASDEEIRRQKAKMERGAAVAEEEGDETTKLKRDERTLTAIYRAAAAEGVAAWPETAPQPPEVLELHGFAVPETLLFLAEVQADRGRRPAAERLLGELIAGPPTGRRPLARSRLARLVAEGGSKAVAAELARRFDAGPDGPRLKVWAARWTAELAKPEEPEPEETPGEASDGREPVEEPSEPSSEQDTPTAGASEETQSEAATEEPAVAPAAEEPSGPEEPGDAG
ncbi:MAG: hypothetical protein AAF907_00220 [Planctomycetota bacterium]